MREMQIMCAFVSLCSFYRFCIQNYTYDTTIKKYHTHSIHIYVPVPLNKYSFEFNVSQ